MSGQAYHECLARSVSQAPGPTLLGATVVVKTSAKEKEISNPTRTSCLGKGSLWVTTAPASPFHNIPLKMLGPSASVRQGQSRGWWRCRRHKYCSNWLPPSTSIKLLASKWGFSIDCSQNPLSSAVQPADQDICPNDEPTLPLTYSSRKQTLPTCDTIEYNPPFQKRHLSSGTLTILIGLALQFVWCTKVLQSHKDASVTLATPEQRWNTRLTKVVDVVDSHEVWGWQARESSKAAASL